MYPDTIIFRSRSTGHCALALLLPVVCGCLPSYHLQHFSGRLLTSPNTIQVERGQEELSTEFSAAISGNFFKETMAYPEGSYYDFETGNSDPTAENCFIETSTRQVSLYCAVLGKKLVSGKFETQFGMIDNRLFYNFSPGIGVRLFKNDYAGRVWFSAGLVKMDCEVFVFENDDDESDYDLKDTYDDIIPFMGITLAFNTNFPSAFVNPFVNVAVRYYSLFRFQDIAASLIPLYLTAGIHKTFGPFTASFGLQIDGYDTMQMLSVHPVLLGQVGFHL